MSQPSPDRFTLPGDIPDAGYRGASTHAAPDDARTLSHPAGRGWVPASRDLGIPSEHASTPVHEHRTITIEHAFPHGSPDDPVAAVGCSQVFTRERRVRFLDHLAFKGNVRAAAALVGVSHETAYRKRRQDAAFAALWDAALVHARKYNEAVLASRALDGEEVPVYYRGEIVGYRVVHDTRLLLAHLARLDRRVEDDEAAAARATRFDELLAGYAGQEAPEGFAEAAEEALDWRERGEAPALPPTREEYVAWRRGQAVGGKSRRKEAEAMEAAAEAAGAEWDAWHAAALERVGAMVEVEAEDPWAEKAPDPQPSPLAGEGGAPTGAEGEGSAAPAAASPLPPAGGAGGGHEEDPAQAHPPTPSREREGEDGTLEPEPQDAVPTDLPYEIKSYPSAPADFAPRNPVTCVNPRKPEPLPRVIHDEVAPAASAPRPPASPPASGGRPTMNKTIRGAAVALGTLALAATASAQEAESQQQAQDQQQAESQQAPPNQQRGGPPQAANQYVSTDPILFASLDIGGSGNFTGVLDPDTNELCYILNADGVDQPTAAHIHVGGPGESGQPVVPLETPDDGASGGCVAIEASVAQALLANPGGYYVNIHNAAYPQGVVRAQLKGQV